MPMRPAHLVRFLLVLPVLWSSACTTAASAATFQSASTGHWTMLWTKESAVADFDGDGHLDVAACSFMPAVPRLTLFRNPGDGTLVAMDTLTAIQDGSVAAADLDGDGDVDLAAEGRGTISIWLNLGSFTFGPRLDYTLGALTPSTGGIAIGQLTGDTRPDIVAPDTTDALVIWRNDGGGVVTATERLPFTGAVWVIRLADLDADSDLDVVVLENHCEGCSVPDYHVRVFLNLGGGSFAPGVAYPAGPGYGLNVGDLDDDGVPDIVAGSYFFRGQGNGLLDPATPYGGLNESIPTIADLNQDGTPDLVSRVLSTSAPVYDDSLYVRLGLGGGLLDDPAVVHTSWGVNDLDVADFNGDSHPDLLVTILGYSEVRVHFGDGLGGFPPLRTYPAGGPVERVEIADVTGDGIRDVLALSPTSNLLRLLRGLGGGLLGSPQDVAAPAGSVALVAGDFDGDGREDAATIAGSTLTVYPSQGASGLGAPVDYALPGPAGCLAAADITADGIPDLLAICGPSGTLSVYPGTAGAGLGVRVDHAVTLSHTTSVAVAEATGDAIPDVVAIGVVSSQVHARVLPGQPGGTLGSPIQSDLQASQNSYRGCIVADATDDGVADALLFTGNSLVSTNHVVRPNNGAGTLTVSGASSRFVGRGVQGTAVADFDGDGLLDIATANLFPGAIGVSMQLPGGDFAPPRSHGGSRLAHDVAAGDLNGDGRSDLVGASRVSESVNVLLNATGGSLGVPHGGADRAARLAIARVWPTVATDRLNLEFSLPARGVVSVALFDLAGRRLLSRDLGELEAGPQARALALPRELPPGLVWLRLRQGALGAVTRAVVAR